MTGFQQNQSAATSQVVILPNLPELRDPDFLDKLLPPSPKNDDLLKDNNAEKGTKDKRTHPFMDGLLEAAQRTRTTNNAPAYNSTGSATLDAFNSLQRWTSTSDINRLLREAWAEDESLTLRIIWNTRSIPDGKSERILFYRCWSWLFDNHPRTAIINLDKLVQPLWEQRRKRESKSAAATAAGATKEGADKKPEYIRRKAHGYWKDLLNLVSLVACDQIEDERPKFLNSIRLPWTYPNDAVERKTKPYKWDDETKLRVQEHDSIRKRAQAAGISTRMLIAQERFEVLQRKAQSPKFRALYIAVARLFADQLWNDIELLQVVNNLPRGEERTDAVFKISLAAKWAPSPGAAHDRVTNLSTAIALLLLEKTPASFQPAGLRGSQTDALTEATISRSVYRRWTLTPLRSCLQLPEVAMSAGQWNKVVYTRVASLAMSRYNHLFFTHDSDRFKEFIGKVETGTKQISGATLMPHELIAKVLTPVSAAKGKVKKFGPAAEELFSELAKMEARVVEAQWKSLINHLQESGSLGDALAVCDVSGSMGYAYSGITKGRVQPILPAVALSLVIASLAQEPFSNGFITFSADPKFIKLDLDNAPLKESVEKTLQSGFGMNTNFRAVFLDLVLPMAKARNLRKEDMVKRIFVFSDMQFDTARATFDFGRGYQTEDPSSWESTFEEIARKYAEEGFEVPQLVFWDLAGGKTVEVDATYSGVALMSGFSPAMLKVFMGEAAEEETENEDWEEVDVDGKKAAADDEVVEDCFDPLKIMEKALLVKSFDTLRVVD